MAKLGSNHLGRAGHLAVMAELLLLGYNVAIPEVDVGDDIFVVDDQEGNLSRVQVKTTFAQRQKNGTYQGHYLVPQKQLRLAKTLELSYVFALRVESQFEYVVISRKELLGIRAAFEATSKLAAAQTETLNLKLTFGAEEVTGWQASFQGYRNGFRRYFPPLAT